MRPDWGRGGLVTIQDYKEMVERELKKQLGEIEQENIESYVRKTLENKRQEVICKLLGFNNSWHEWELDHCNGRAGESEAGTWLRRRVGAGAAKWLEEQVGQLPDIPTKAIGSLKREYTDMLKRAVREGLERVAHTEAARIIRDISGQDDEG